MTKLLTILMGVVAVGLAASATAAATPSDDAYLATAVTGTTTDGARMDSLKWIQWIRWPGRRTRRTD